MGYIRHHAIIVTSSGYDEADAALKSVHAHSEVLGAVVTPIVDSKMNGHKSFMVCPDGSKEGWEDSAAGDAARAAIIAYLRSTQYEDGSGPLSWAEVQFGDDNRETIIVDHSDKRKAARKGGEK